MKRIFIIFILLFELAGCCSYIDSLEHWHYKNWESLEFMKNYCIYNYESPRFGVCDEEKHIPAHYQIYIPNKLKKMKGVDFDRCFLYSKNRGIAIFQDLSPWQRKYAKGLRIISKDSVEYFVEDFCRFNHLHIKVKENRLHYLYVDDEMRIVFFNLSETDINDFVDFPLSHLLIKKHGEVRADGKTITGY